MVISRRRAVLSAAPFALAVSATSAFAQAPALDNIRPIPPPGIAVPDADRDELAKGVQSLGDQIAALKTELKGKPALLRYLPDVQIYYNAVRYALTYNEFFNPREIATAKQLLTQGMDRATALQAGSAPWTTQTGLVALGYVSKIDGSVQPYGMTIPPTWVAGEKKKHRLDFFLHGRGETLSEVAFIEQRQRSAGDFSPPDAFVLQPYGRFCNANRFAGEVDLFEALADAEKRYPIDDDRLIMRGFSMGGGSCWQYATHHADMWAAAQPGAGFTEVVGFLRLDAPGVPPRPWYEQKLWHWYNSTDYAANLYQLPVVAYNGDKDGQKQAADAMQAAMAKEGLTLTRVIGVNIGHAYTPEAKKDLDARMAIFAGQGRNTLPPQIHFTTWTLRYNTMDWVTVTGLGQHWAQARVNADRTGDAVVVSTQNVTRFSLSPAAVAGKAVLVDGQTLHGLKFTKVSGLWTIDAGKPAAGLRKSPGLQGPIDDAFMDHFLMVRPTGTPISPQLGAWVTGEMAHAVTAWRTQFRGEALVKDDTAVTPADIASGNLVLWGDPSSNAILARIASKLPVRWAKNGTIYVGAKSYPGGADVPVLIYPNPLNPRHYVVLNSGITFREFAYLNNDEQYAHLPDWAIVDTTTPANGFTPGRIADAGFFDESWKLKPVGAQ